MIMAKFPTTYSIVLVQSLPNLSIFVNQDYSVHVRTDLTPFLSCHENLCMAISQDEDGRFFGVTTMMLFLLWYIV